MAVMHGAAVTRPRVSPGAEATRERLYAALRLVSPLAVLLVWETASRAGVVNRLFLPPPSVIVSVGVASLVHGTLAADILVSTRRLVAGFLLGTALGIGAAAAMARGRTAKLFLDWLITLVYPIPKVAILPLLLIWLGTGDLTRVVIIATGAFFPVAINTYAGVRTIDPVLVRAARNLGASPRQMLRHVVFPAALPGLYAGVVIGAGLSLILLVYAEMTAASSGVGYFTYTAATMFETEKSFAGVFTLAVLGWLWHRLIVTVQAWHCPWTRRA